MYLWLCDRKNGNQLLKDTCTQCLGAFFRCAVATNARALRAAANVPGPVWKSPGGGGWTKRNTNKSWKLATHKQVTCNRKIGRIELAESSLQIWAPRQISTEQSRSCHQRQAFSETFSVFQLFSRFGYGTLEQIWYPSRKFVTVKFCLCHGPGVWLYLFRVCHRTFACRHGRQCVASNKLNPRAYV